jgi:hypothetical protein
MPLKVEGFEPIQGRSDDRAAASPRPLARLLRQLRSKAQPTSLTPRPPPRRERLPRALAIASAPRPRRKPPAPPPVDRTLGW